MSKLGQTATLPFVPDTDGMGHLAITRLKAVTQSLLIVGALFVAEVASAAQLSIRLMISYGAQRTVFVEQINKFAKLHPDIKVYHSEIFQEEFKEKMPSWLAEESGSADVLPWFAGAKLDAFVKKGWIAPLSTAPWQTEMTPGAMAAVTLDGHAYGMPLSLYQWGFYFLKPVFKKHDIDPPVTWADLLTACAKLRRANMTPIALGSSAPWVLAGWFDYLDLRLNGIEFHRQLMRGDVPYTDARVKRVFLKWRELLDAKCFPANHARDDWRTAMPSLYRRKAGMFLIGNFVIPSMPQEVRSEMGFFPFPTLDDRIPNYEEAPLDILTIPSNAKNKKEAELFLAFMADAKVQFTLNDAMGMIPANKNSPESQDPFISAGTKLIRSAKGITHYFDRDSIVEMNRPAMEKMAEFMQNPDSLDRILQDLEVIRSKSYQSYLRQSGK